MHQQDSADSLRFLVDHHIYDTGGSSGTFSPRYSTAFDDELAAVLLSSRSVPAGRSP